MLPVSHWRNSDGYVRAFIYIFVSFIHNDSEGRVILMMILMMMILMMILGMILHEKRRSEKKIATHTRLIRRLLDTPYCSKAEYALKRHSPQKRFSPDERQLIDSRRTSIIKVAARYCRLSHSPETNTNG
jgi:hypothetical protein